MICGTCHGGGSRLGAPCPECHGSGITYCCDGLTACNDAPDLTDIPEADEEWFKRAKRLMPATARKRRDPIYDWQWDQFVLTLIRERGRVCESEHHSGERTLTILQVVYGDHVVELRDGGPKLDPENVRLSCAKCHGRKTYRERQRRNGNRNAETDKPELGQRTIAPTMDES